MVDIYRKEIVDPGDRASLLGKNVCVESYNNCPAVKILDSPSTGFRGPVVYSWQQHILASMLQNFHSHQWVAGQSLENDGAGGKPQFFTLIGTKLVMRGAGWEIIVMCADDLARWGMFPCIMVNEVQAKGVTEDNFHLVEALFEGYGEALKASGLVNITGEFAILKHSLTAFCDVNDGRQFVFLWSGACQGLSYNAYNITGKNIKPGMVIVGFWDPGYRCNGGTRLTGITLGTWGPDIRNVLENPEARKFVEKLTVPSMSYAKTVTRLVGWNSDGSIGTPLAKIHGIAHITGGGLWGKLGDILPDGVGAHINGMPDPAPCLLEAQGLSLRLSDPKLHISDEAAYDVFHGACGEHLIVEPGHEQRVIDEAAKDGIRAYVVGETIASPNQKITVVSRFMQKFGQEIHPPV
jgi:phosphoribosylformylglycinamidine cyclo-ligase